MAKSKKIEKETRKLIAAVSDLVKKKNGQYRFKSKNKKLVKRVKKTCVHWIMRKGKEYPTVVSDPDRAGYWKCTICGASFPIKPLVSTDKSFNPYDDQSRQFLELVNQMQFWSVKLGGDAEDTKMFIELKKNLPRFGKVSKQILKRVNQREEYERNRAKSDAMSQFDVYSGYNYRP